MLFVSWFMPLTNRTTTVTLKGHPFAVQTLQHADTWRTFPAWLAEETGLDALVCDRLGHGQSGPFDRPRSSATTCSGKRRRPCPPCWAHAESAR